MPTRISRTEKLLREYGLGLITDSELRDEMVMLWFPELVAA